MVGHDSQQGDGHIMDSSNSKRAAELDLEALLARKTNRDRMIMDRYVYVHCCVVYVLLYVLVVVGLAARDRHTDDAT